MQLQRRSRTGDLWRQSPTKGLIFVIKYCPLSLNCRAVLYCTKSDGLREESAFAPKMQRQLAKNTGLGTAGRSFLRPNTRQRQQGFNTEGGGYIHSIFSPKESQSVSCQNFQQFVRQTTQSQPQQQYEHQAVHSLLIISNSRSAVE